MYFSKKRQWKLILFVTAIVIGLSSMWYTNRLVRELANEERKRVELWAEAQKRLLTAADLEFYLKIITDNKTIPVILVNEKEQVLGSRNLNPRKEKNANYLKRQLEIMKDEHDPIVVNLSDGTKNYVYYKDSTLLTKLYYFPFIQLAVMFLFILVSYWAFSASRQAEQNQVWVGMSKETAHQLGTPISSLMALLELLKIKNIDQQLLVELEKDIKRLSTITERFSKIGSAPDLKTVELCPVLENSVAYLKTRTSSKISYSLKFSSSHPIKVPLNIALFDWVIENLCKNAVDAISGNGCIDLMVIEHSQEVTIDLTDTGKGIPKNKLKSIFHPGFTSKSRGWGLGLSLAKRIIEEYHQGKIFVKQSEINKGTTFRIVLRKTI